MIKMVVVIALARYLSELRSSRYMTLRADREGRHDLSVCRWRSLLFSRTWERR